MAQPVNVDFPVNGFIFKTSGLSQNGSVFRYHIMAVKYQILRGLTFACTGIHITADQPGAGGLHQISPVAVLPHRFIGSGKIDNHRGTRNRMSRGRRIRSPYILADLTAYLQPFDGITTKQNMRSERDFLPVKQYGSRFFPAGRKMSDFIKFPVIGDGSLGNKSQYFPVMKHCRRIIKLSFHLQRKPHKYKGVLSPGMGCNILQRFLCSL